MRILVAAAHPMDRSQAHAINTVKMAQGFGRLGHEVLFVCLHAENLDFAVADAERLYGMDVSDNVRLKPVRAVSPDWSFAWRAVPVLWGFRPDVVYARNYVLPWMASRLGYATVAESHAEAGYDAPPFRRLCAASRHRAFRLWVTISPALVDYYVTRGVAREKLAVLPDAVDTRLFGRPEAPPPSPYEPTQRPRVVYAGHLYDYKGIPTVIEAAALMPECDIHLVGGLPEDLRRQKKRAVATAPGNVFFHGQVPHADVPPYLWHADVLLLPPSAKHPSAQWTSPVKLGEYLASGVPVVSTRIPALKHWLTERETRWAEPDDPESLAGAVRDVLSDPAAARSMAAAGLKMAQALTYERRAESILAHPSVASYLEGRE